MSSPPGIQHRNRLRLYILFGIFDLALLLVIGFFFITRRDNCTQSFDRSPASVVSAYVHALAAGDPDQAARCWDPAAFSAANSGCSSSCIQPILGTSFHLLAVDVINPAAAQDGTQVQTQVSLLCPGSNAEQTGSATLSAIQSWLPWRRWKITYSTIGGAPGQPWCR